MYYYFKEAELQLKCENVFEELFLYQYHLTNVNLYGDIGNESLDYFVVSNNPKLGRFSSSEGSIETLYLTVDITTLLDSYFETLAKEVNLSPISKIPTPS